MNSQDLRRYLGLDDQEFLHLLRNQPDALERYIPLAVASDNLEQLPSRYNRPPETADDDPIHDALDAVSAAAFARLDALIAEHEEFRRVRSDAPRGRRRGGKRYRHDDPFMCGTSEIDCDVARRLAAKVKNLGQGR